MSRESMNQYGPDGTLLNGFDYDKQAWVMNGVYMDCAHPFAMDCDCYGRKHAGEPCTATIDQSNTDPENPFGL